MYKSAVFTTENQNEVLDFMNQNAFVTLIGFDGDFPIATQVPVIVAINQDSIQLFGHVMTKTDHCRAFEKHPNVLVMFTGAHAYISAAVYENPQSVSTWNYKTVQVKGTIKLLNPDDTYQTIKRLTDQYENPEKSPAAFHKMNEDYLQKNLKAITGFEILVTQIDHVFKLSQNHSVKNKENIISNLENNGDALSHEVAKEMKKIL